MDSKEETGQSVVDANGRRYKAESKGPGVPWDKIDEISYERRKARAASLQSQGQAELGIHSTEKDVSASEPELPMSCGGNLHNDSIGHSPLQGSQPEDALRGPILESSVSPLSHMDRREPGGSVQDGDAAARVELKPGDSIKYKAGNRKRKMKATIQEVDLFEPVLIVCKRSKRSKLEIKNIVPTP